MSYTLTLTQQSVLRHSSNTDKDGSSIYAKMSQKEVGPTL